MHTDIFHPDPFHVDEIDLEWGDVLVRYWWRRKQSCFRYRCDPVPYVRNYTAGSGIPYRRMRTTQERRMSILDEEEVFHGVKVRARRNKRNLADSWWDFYRSDFRNKSWKRHRKTQYRVKIKG